MKPDAATKKQRDFLGWAVKAYAHKTGQGLPLIEEEWHELCRVLRSHDLNELKFLFKDLLDKGVFQNEPRPLSIFIVKADGRMLSEHCVARCHIPNEFFPVYDFAVAVSVEKGNCWLSSRVSAKWCCCSRMTAHRAIQWLVKHEWLIELRKPAPGRRGRGKYEPVSHADWIAEHGSGYSLEEHQQCVTVEPDEEDS